jgi:Outer membrane lipoprotein
MKKNKIVFFLICTLLTSVGFAALQQKSAVNTVSTTDAKNDLEKLTGVRALTFKQPSEKALYMARESRDQKNYILAIKRYNYIIKNFPKTKEATQALLDKSAIYKKMGFDIPSKYNLKKAVQFSANQNASGILRK